MEIILIVYLVVSIALIGIILLQQGKGAEMGASFGAGGANTVFGASGSGNVLTKTTTILAILFFATAIAISYINSAEVVETDSIIDVVPADQATPKLQDSKSLDAELPVATKGVESEVAPAQKAATDAKDNTEKKVEAAKEKVAEDKEEEKKEGEQ